MEFVLDSIYMDVESDESGAEEFHVAGFVQEFVPGDVAFIGQQFKFGPHYAVLDIDGPREKTINHAGSFFLEKPSAPSWPRVYTVFISVLEEDDGESLSDWQSQLWNVANNLATGEIGQAILDALQDELKDHLDELDQMIQTG